MSSVFGVGASESTTDFPDASWPVTILRGTELIAAFSSRQAIGMSWTSTSAGRGASRRSTQ